MQNDNPLFSRCESVDVSSITNSILSLSSSSTGSDARRYTPFSNIGLLQHQQGGSVSDGPPYPISVTSQESTRIVSYEQSTN